MRNSCLAIGLVFVQLTCVGDLAAQTHAPALSSPHAGASEPRIDVRDYGSDPTGRTESTFAIQSAVNSCPAAGCQIALGPGIFKITRTIVIDRDNVQIAGAGIETTQVLAAEAAIDVFSFGLGTIRRTGGAVRDLSINVSGTAKTGGAAVKFNKTLNTTAERLRIANQFVGIHLHAANIARVRSNYIVNTVANSGIGILVDGEGNDQFLSENELDAPDDRQPRAGIAIRQSGGLWAWSNSVVRHRSGLSLQPTKDKPVENLFFRDNAFDLTSGNPCIIEPGSQAYVRRVSFHGDWFSSGGDAGILIDSSGTTDAVEFIGIKAFNNVKEGFRINGGANIKVIGGLVSGNSRLQPGEYAGVYIGAGVSDFSVIGLTSGVVAQHGNFQKSGLEVAAGPSNNYLIALNDFRKNLNAGLVDAGTGSHKQVFANRLDSRQIPTEPVPGRFLTAAVDWNPGTLADGASKGTKVRLEGALVGDFVLASFDHMREGNWQISGYVTGPNTVWVSVTNSTGGTKTLPTGKLRVAILKAGPP